MTWWTFITGRQQAARLERKVAAARAAIFLERLWLALWPALMVAGVYALYVISGLAAWLPGWSRPLIACGFLTALVWSGRQLAALRRPSREQALARIERASGLEHHPLAALADTLPQETHDPRTKALWTAHKARLAATLGRLRAGWPRSGVPRKDPCALRNGLALALIATAWLGGFGQFGHKLRASLTPDGAMPAQVSLDAWLTPPSYTGKPPLVLASASAAKARREPIIAPQGARLTLRLSGGLAPSLELYALDPSGGKGRHLSSTAFLHAGQSGAFKLEKTLKRPTIAIVRDGGKLAQWSISILPDNAPLVSLTHPPAHTISGGLQLRWKASDDYGITTLRATFALAPSAADAPGADKPLQFKPPHLAIPLPAALPRQASGRFTGNLAAHPWAGMEVIMRLAATDQAGNTGHSKPYRFILPGRVFRKPLARALIEQRRDLIRHPKDSRNIATILAALLAWPEGIADDSGTYLGLRHAAFALYGARTDKQLKDIVALLWELAVNIEDGDLSDAARQLEAARKALEDALNRKASEAEIARRVEDLRKAMNRYLRDMARQMQNNPQARRQAGNGREISPRDLQRMLDKLENLARTGARDAARQMLAELDDMLKNLQAGNAPSGPPSPQSQALNELQKLMREQQDLMDETWRARPGQSGQPQQRPEEPGRLGNNGQPQSRQQGRRGAPGKMGDLARRQQQLEQKLRDLMQRMENRGARPPQGLKKSGRAMQGATGALNRGKRGKALKKQGQALRAMREGARKLARQVARQQGRGQGRFGRAGQGFDPLGRPVRNYGESRGPDRNMLPSESAIERARRILQTLRKRASRPDRPRTELDYIDRLLKGLY